MLNATLYWIDFESDGGLYSFGVKMLSRIDSFNEYGFTLQY